MLRFRISASSLSCTCRRSRMGAPIGLVRTAPMCCLKGQSAGVGAINPPGNRAVSPSRPSRPTPREKPGDDTSTPSTTSSSSSYTSGISRTADDACADFAVVYGGTNSKQSAYNTCVNLQRAWTPNGVRFKGADRRELLAHRFHIDRAARLPKDRRTAHAALAAMGRPRAMPRAGYIATARRASRRSQ